MNKKDSIYLKGWAVLFMIFLHFGSDFIAPQYRYNWGDGDWKGAFQICVPIFLFLSGYGLMTGSIIKNEFGFMSLKKQMMRAMKLLIHYWIVVLPFIVIALYQGIFSWSWDSFVLTATTLRSDWCPNAWFMALYIELILLFPLFYSLFRYKGMKRDLILFLLIVISTKLLGKIDWINYTEGNILARQIKMVLIDMPIFIEGMLFAKYALMNTLLKRISTDSQYIKSVFFGGGMICVASIACRAKLPLIGVTELIHVPLCLVGLLLVSMCMKRLFVVISYVGKYSTTLWLIHGYFCWTFLQSFIYSVRFWPLAYLIVVIFSLVASIIMEKIKSWLFNSILCLKS